jgi:hypothetical protein
MAAENGQEADCMSKKETISMHQNLAIGSKDIVDGKPPAKKSPRSPMSSGVRRTGPRRGSLSEAGGWHAMTQRCGAIYHAYFFDDHYASGEQAHAAAKAFHAALQERLPKPYSNGSDGLPGGVWKATGVCSGWIAYLNFDKKEHQKRFSSNKYGEEGAERMARETLASWRKTYGVDQARTLPSQAEIAQILQSIQQRFQCTLSTPNSHPSSAEMLRRLHAAAREAGLECLATEWEGVLAMYSVRCGHGHEFIRIGSGVLKGVTVCERCRGQRRLEYIQEIAQAKGGRCLESTYLGYVPHRFVCAHGHEWKTNPSQIVNGRTWCPRCGNIAMVQRLTKKDGPERLQRIAAEKGGKCFIDTYTNGSGRHRFQCAEGHDWEAKASNILRGAWCQVCALNGMHAQVMAEAAKRFRQVVKDKGGVCLDDYAGGDKRYRIICAHGHEWTGIGSYITNGRWCRQCGDGDKRQRYTDALRQYAKERGGALLSEYVNGKTKVQWECDRGHRWHAVPGSGLVAKSWCPECAHMNKLSNRKSTAKLRYQTAPLHSGELTRT